MLKDFFSDFKTAINELATDFALLLFHPRQWNIAKKIASNSRKN